MNFLYPPDLIAHFPINPSIVDTTTLPPATDRKDGIFQRQPVLSLDRPSSPGSLTETPTINPAQELAAKGKPLAPNQIEYLRRRIAETGGWVPGTLYVTLLLAPAPDGRWQVKRWVYNFEARWQEVLNLPPPKCPPGSPGTWPDCDRTPGPPPPPPPPPECVNSDERWHPETQRCERVQTGRPGKGLKFFLNE